MAVMDQQTAVAEGSLLKLPFSTIYEYLQMLRLIAEALKDVGPCSMFYLAAAVSDFYVPWKSMTEHKIESGSGPLDIRLAQVPKMLSVLRSNWAPKAFCISFKVNLSLYSLFFLVLILRNPMMYMQILDSA
jgi:phosphopantothenate-cysteine ligase